MATIPVPQPVAGTKRMVRLLTVSEDRLWEFRPVLHCSACDLELHGSQIQVGGDPPKAVEPKADPR